MFREPGRALAVMVFLLLLAGAVPPVHGAPGEGAGNRGSTSTHLMSAPEASPRLEARGTTAPTDPVTPSQGKLAVITVISFTNASTAGLAPLAVTFALSLWDNGTGLTYPVTYTINWTFGDGSQGAQAIIESPDSSSFINTTQKHVYTSDGNYSAFVAISSNEPQATGYVDFHKDFVYVEPPLRVAWNSTRTAIDVGSNLTVSAQISGGAAPYAVVWLDTPAGCFPETIYLNCTPVNTGPYSAHLQATDFHGLRTNSYYNFSVKPALTVRLSYQSWFFCTGTVGTFQANFTAYTTTGTSPYTYNWDYGDGTPNGTGPNVTHRFALGPTYNVTVTVVDSGGGHPLTQYILVPADYAACTSSTSVSYAPPLLLLQGGIFLLVIILVVLGVLYLRRRPPPPGGPVSSWKAGEPTSPGDAGSEAPAPTPPPTPP